MNNQKMDMRDFKGSFAQGPNKGLAEVNWSEERQASRWEASVKTELTLKKNVIFITAQPKEVNESVDVHKTDV